jgi:hypothetical protein
MPTATRNAHSTATHTTEPGLFLAFELSEKTWKLGFTTGHGQKPRERCIAALHQARLLQEVAQAKRRLGLPDTAPVVSCSAQAAESIGGRAFAPARIDGRWRREVPTPQEAARHRRKFKRLFARPHSPAPPSRQPVSAHPAPPEALPRRVDGPVLYTAGRPQARAAGYGQDGGRVIAGAA